MERIGVWTRARRFGDDPAAAKEIESVRTEVGMLDASTLGKFRLFGPDAEKALQRVYAGDMTRISDGRIKYAAMCNEDGCVIDDGVVIKEGENDYYLTTSTGRAGETVAWFRYHTRFEELGLPFGQPDRRHGRDQSGRTQRPQGVGKSDRRGCFQRGFRVFPVL